jgi:hypothetical protein
MRQQCDLTSIINEVRQQVTESRNLPVTAWQVTPEMAKATATPGTP